jgi:16S rRNA G966 N2-methylase RsmD
VRWHIVLKRSNVEFLCRDYREITTNENDYVFLDPPYPNTTGFYYGKISVEDMWKWIRTLKCKYSLTFDGIADGKDITYEVPSDIYSKHIYLKEKLSNYRNITSETDKPAYVAESLYIK